MVPPQGNPGASPALSSPDVGEREVVVDSALSQLVLIASQERRVVTVSQQIAFQA